jgi:hypothetical protein
LKLKAAHPRHLDVEYQTFGVTVWQRRQELLARPECFRIEPAGAKEARQGFQYEGVIVHNGDPGRFHEIVIV